MSHYHPLTLDEAVALARSIPNHFSEQAELLSEEIGDGNLNLVFRITDAKTRKGIIIKQALPYAKVVGESWPLSLDRARIEREALQIQYALVPDLVPAVFNFDNDLAVTVMEDLSDHTIMRKGLIDGHHYPLFAEHIGKFIAHTLFYTSDLGMNQQQKKEQLARFINPDLCKISEDLIFEDPYRDSPNNNIPESIRTDAEALWNDKELKLEIALLRESFLTHTEALLHGDLHTGSIFVTASSTKVIDPEFAYYGPMGFDIGAVIGNLLLNYAAQPGWSATANKLNSQREFLLQTILNVWEHFESNFIALWNRDIVDITATTPGYQDIYIQKILRDTIGFAGAKMIRRIVGLSHVADVDTIEDEYVRIHAQRTALRIGTSLVKLGRKATHIQEIITIAKAAVLEEVRQ
ncbi:5-methylthioribose kinase [Paenibacillus shirakamiensis]|uniref:Methylthioribose kinase n=1 Tax=Paenibacillus shirakamiensis TaxID=1265935 RepID=A0ABS4JLJ2_9BACL|nr:S-methyl-5-thioribose kinase [Paenibacillus shirakamiensis]MBP2002592.1 5-methylthioribose kinase [Paenibacillus shirakamiensis]